MSELVEPYGDVLKGQGFDDGVYDGVSKVIVGVHDTHGVVHLKMDYMKDGTVVEKRHGRATGQQITESVFAFDYPNEYITEIYGKFHKYVNETVLVLQFLTSRGISSQMFGKHDKHGLASIETFILDADGTELVGLLGRSGDVINAIGGRFATVCPAYKRHNAIGGREGGNHGVTWDDGAYEGVKRVLVGESDGCLSYIKFEYRASDNNLVTHSHGLEPEEEPKEFALLDDEEYISSIEGTYDDDVPVELKRLSSLRFKTSKNRESMLFGKEIGTKFIIQGEGHHTKVVGFRGLSFPNSLSGLGANFTVAPPRGIVVVKGEGSGSGWNDGVHSRVHQIRVTSGWANIHCIDFKYVDDNIIVNGEHGETPPETVRVSTDTFELGVDDYITSVEVGMTPYNHDTLSVAVLTIKTNSGRVRVLGSDRIGPNMDPILAPTAYNKRFTLKKRGHKIVGFFGRSSEVLEEIGVYVEPINDE